MCIECTGVRQTLAPTPVVLLTHPTVLGKPDGFISELPCAHLYNRHPFTQSAAARSAHLASTVAVTRANNSCATNRCPPEGDSILQTTVRLFFYTTVIKCTSGKVTFQQRPEGSKGKTTWIPREAGTSHLGWHCSTQTAITVTVGSMTCSPALTFGRSYGQPPLAEHVPRAVPAPGL